MALTKSLNSGITIKKKKIEKLNSQRYIDDPMKRDDHTSKQIFFFLFEDSRTSWIKWSFFIITMIFLICVALER